MIEKLLCYLFNHVIIDKAVRFKEVCESFFICIRCKKKFIKLNPPKHFNCGNKLMPYDGVR